MFMPQARFDPSAPRPISVLYTNTGTTDIPGGAVIVANNVVQVVLGSGIRALGSNNGPNTGSVAIGFGWFDFLCDASTFTTPFTAVYWNPTGSPVDQTGTPITALASTGCLTTNSAGAYQVGFTHPEQPAPLILGDAARARAWLQQGPGTYGNTLGAVLAGGVSQDIFTVSATQNYNLGTIHETSDGRRFRYSQAGASGISRALMQQSPALNAKFVDITQTGHAQVVGATAITVLCTTGSALPLNYFAGGKMIVTTGSGSTGDIYSIVSSKLEGTDTLLDLVLAEPLRNAIAATSKVTLIPNRWASTIVMPTTATGAAAGVPLVDVGATYFYWAQTKGPAPLIGDTSSALVVGAKAGVGATVAGTALKVASTTYSIPFYGTVMWVGADAEPALINLELE